MVAAANQLATGHGKKMNRKREKNNSVGGLTSGMVGNFIGKQGEAEQVKHPFCYSTKMNCGTS
jgi:hypothetical protein